MEAQAPDGGASLCGGDATVCEHFDDDDDPVPLGWQKKEMAGGTVLLVASDLSKPFALQSRLPAGDGGEQQGRVHRIFTFGGGAFDIRIEIQVRINLRADPIAPAVPFLYLELSPISFFNVAAITLDHAAAAVVTQNDAGGQGVTQVATEFELSPKIWHRFVVRLAQGAVGSATARVDLDDRALIPGDVAPIDVGRIAGPNLDLYVGAYVPAAAGAVEIDYDDLRVDFE
jgi:hypothetical protein